MGNRVSGRLVSVGFGNYVAVDAIVAVLAAESAPGKRLMQKAREDGRLLDATAGRKTRAVVVTDSDYIVNCAVMPETISNRLSRRDDKNTEDEMQETNVQDDER